MNWHLEHPKVAEIDGYYYTRVGTLFYTLFTEQYPDHLYMQCLDMTDLNNVSGKLIDYHDNKELFELLFPIQLMSLLL